MEFIPVLNIEGTSASSSPYKGEPCIWLQYSFQKPVKNPNGRLEMNGLHRVLALLDTGSDYNLLDETLFPTHVKPIEFVTSQGVNGVSECGNYEVTLHIKEADMFHETGILSMPHRPGRAWQMILGRKFLQNTRFVYDAHRGIQNLEFFSNPNAV